MAFNQHSSRSKRLRVLTTGFAAFITVALLMAYQFVSDRKQLEEELRTGHAVAVVRVDRDGNAALVDIETP